MPVTKYSYTKDVVVGTLDKAIHASAIVTPIAYITNVGDALDVFMSDALSGGDETILNDLVSGQVIPAPMSDLDAAKLDAKAEIDTAAGQARSRYITVTPGQSAVYLRKAANAKAYLDAGSPAINEEVPEEVAVYPYVVAEKKAKNTTHPVAAQSLDSIAKQWDSLAAVMEEIRIQYKDLISNAPDVETVALHKYNGRVALDNM